MTMDEPIGQPEGRIVFQELIFLKLNVRLNWSGILNRMEKEEKTP